MDSAMCDSMIKRLVAAVAVVIGAALPSHAQVVAVGVVTHESGKPLAGITVRLVPFGENVTTGSGEFRITLPPSIGGGNMIEVRVKPDDWVIKNHVNNRVVLPSAPTDPIRLVLARRGSLSLLTDERIRKIIDDAVKRRTAEAGQPADSKRSIEALIRAQVEQLGIPAAEGKKLIEAWVAKTPTNDPYASALRAYARGEYEDAVLKAREAKLRDKASFVQAAILEGNAHLARDDLKAAVEAFDEALAMDPESGESLLAVGVVCGAAKNPFGMPTMSRPACPGDWLSKLQAAARSFRNRIPRDYVLEAMALMAVGLAAGFDADVCKATVAEALDINKTIGESNLADHVLAIAGSISAVQACGEDEVARQMLQALEKQVTPASTARLHWLHIAVDLAKDDEEKLRRLEETVKLCAQLLVDQECDGARNALFDMLSEAEKWPELLKYVDDWVARATKAGSASIRMSAQLTRAMALATIITSDPVSHLRRYLTACLQALLEAWPSVSTNPSSDSQTVTKARVGVAQVYISLIEELEGDEHNAAIDRIGLHWIQLMEKHGTPQDLKQALLVFADWLENEDDPREAEFRKRAAAIVSK